MSASQRFAAVLASSLLASSAANAAGGSEGNALADFGWYTLNFVLLLAALIFFARKPIKSFFADRRAQIQEQLEHASETLAAAERRNAELQRQLGDLDRDLQEIRERARERAESEGQRVLADANAAALRIENDAKAAVEREVERAREQLRQEASELAIEIATARLQSQIDDTDRSRLVDEFIDHIETSTSAGPEGSR